jgi:hypothetical protein
MSEQLPLFTEAQYAKLDEIATPGGVKVTWDRAQDKRIWNMFVGLVDWALFAPATLQRGMGWVETSIVEDRWSDIVIERLARVMRWTQELTRETGEARDKADLQKAYRRLVEKKDDAKRLTNWEVCFVLMECSMQAPLRREMFMEYMRAFARCFGLEKYMQVQAERFEPLRLSDLEGARYDDKVARRFPLLDDEERAWIEDFNRRGSALRWPGTNMTVKVTEPQTEEVWT